MFSIITFILCHIQKGLKFQSFPVIHHASNLFVESRVMIYAESTHYQIKAKECFFMSERERERELIPVLVNVWPLYDAHKRSSSSCSFPLSSSSLLHLTRSRKFFHSSAVNDHFMEEQVSFANRNDT